jgi:AcrR family transcriptional regulator
MKVMKTSCHTEASKDLDPRVRRTRKMLQDALAQLLKEKEFDRISIGDIAEAATLNRATFYDHYPDKFALLQSLVATQFEELIVKQNIRFDSCEVALKAVAMAVCYYLVETIKPGSEALRQASTPMETAIVSVVRRGILDGFAKHPPKSGMPVQILSSTVAWAIYGAAKEWVQSPKRMPVPKIGETIEKIIMPILLS